MFPFLRPAAQAPQDGAQERLDRVVAVLRRYERAGMPSLPVSEVLEMLGAAAGTPAEPEAPARDPRADPLTGCRPVTAPGKG